MWEIAKIKNCTSLWTGRSAEMPEIRQVGVAEENRMKYGETSKEKFEWNFIRRTRRFLFALNLSLLHLFLHTHNAQPYASIFSHISPTCGDLGLSFARFTFRTHYVRIKKWKRERERERMGSGWFKSRARGDKMKLMVEQRPTIQGQPTSKYSSIESRKKEIQKTRGEENRGCFEKRLKTRRESYRKWKGIYLIKGQKRDTGKKLIVITCLIVEIKRPPYIMHE